MMDSAIQGWERLGRLIEPVGQTLWLHSHAGAACASPTEHPDLWELYIAGRDRLNRSQIGRALLRLEPRPHVIAVDAEPVMPLGQLGAFDENGTSYPCVVPSDGGLRLYYTGWMPSVLTPFQNHLGLALANGERKFARYSRAPILERTDEDFSSIGSVMVLQNGAGWKMWYTAFVDWGGDRAAPRHRYLIKYARSDDGVRWRRDNTVCIDFKNSEEFAICRPSVYFDGERYHMWYCSRGERYQLGYATSKDGVSWRRMDEAAAIPGEESWDSRSRCYPSVFRAGDFLYLLYCGNDYGREGVGIARTRL